MITSTSNDRVRRVIAIRDKRKARQDTGLFLVEGSRMAGEIPREQIQEAFVTETFLKRQESAPEWLTKGQVPVETVSDSVFRKMSGTTSPQGILALVHFYQYNIEEILKESQGKAPLLLVLEHIQDPGNLGTIFRTAEAAGVSGILMSEDTADVYNPKTIRATMGAILRMPFAYVPDLVNLVVHLREMGIASFAAHLQGNKAYDRADYVGPCAFLIGNEGNGLSDALSEIASERIRIPMEGKAESLNAAVSAALLVYEAQRQRRHNR